MKKILFSIMAIIGLSMYSEAQVKFGLKIGGSLSNQSSNVSNGTKLISRSAFRGYHFGIVTDAKVTSNFYIQPQVLYSKKGAKYNSKTNNVQTSLTLNTIEVPINFLYKMPVSFGKLFIGAGPVFNYSFNGKLTENGVTTELKKDMKNFKRLDISASAIAGFELRNGIFGSASYQMGLRDINQASQINTKNRSLSLSLGYLFNL